MRHQKEPSKVSDGRLATLRYTIRLHMCTRTLTCTYMYMYMYTYTEKRKGWIFSCQRKV